MGSRCDSSQRTEPVNVLVLEVAMRQHRTSSRLSFIALGLCLSLLLSGCSGASEESPGSESNTYEGDEPGECEDEADNDRDMLFDCDDPDCAGAPVCKGETPEGAEDASGSQGSGEEPADAASLNEEEDASESSELDALAPDELEDTPSEEDTSALADGEAQGGFPDSGPEAPEDAYEPVLPGDGPTLYVTKEGEDSAECGDEGAPCLTIAKGLEHLADSGGTLWVGAGQYNESELFVPSGVWLVSGDGPLEAKIYSSDKSAIRFWEVNDAGIDGFEVFGDWNDGAPGDGLVRVFDASRITIRNGIVRDAPSAQDLIKVTGALETLVLENLVFLNPGKPSGGNNFQQALEIFGSKAPSGDLPSIRDVVIRGCWFMQSNDIGGDDMLFLRASVAEVLIENNVFGPCSGPGGAARPAVHIGTYNGPQPDQNFPEARDVVVRNNIFAGLRGDSALGVSNSHRVWIYSNVFYDNTGSKLRSVISIRGNVLPVDELHVVDNVFMNNQPSKSGGDLYWLREGGAPESFVHDYNIYFANVLTSDVSYQTEEASLIEVDPALDNPLTPPNWSVPESLDLIHSLYGGFLVSEDSPAVNAGVDAVGMDGHPAWSDASIRRWDILGEPRPLAGQWDIGVHEPLP